MKQLILLFILFLSISSLSAQTKISDAQKSLDFDYLQNVVLKSHVLEIEGTNYLLIWTFDHILKINMDDSLGDAEIIEHKSGCSTRSTFNGGSIISTSDSDIYEIDINSGDEVFHLEINQENIELAEKVGPHYYIHGFQFNAIYNTDLKEMFVLPTAKEYKVVGDQLIGLKGGGVFSEFGDLFHVNLADGSIIVDFDLVNIRNHTLRGEDNEKLFFSTVEDKLYSFDYSDYSYTLICDNFSGLNKILFFKDGQLYTIEITGFYLEAYLYDFNQCSNVRKVGAFEMELIEDFKDIHILSDGVQFVIETNISAYLFNSISILTESDRLNFGTLDAFFVRGDNYFTISTVNLAGMFITSYDISGNILSNSIISAAGLFPYSINSEFGLVYTNENELYKVSFKPDNSPSVRQLVFNGLEEGPYKDSEWKYRNGYFYCLIDDALHYKTPSGQVESIGNLNLNGFPWIDKEGKLVYFSSDDFGLLMWIIDLESGNTELGKELDVELEIKSVIQVNGDYYLVAEDGIYTLDIGNGKIEKFLDANFIPYLTSSVRSLGILEDSNGSRKFVSFDGTGFIEIFQSTSPTLNIIPIPQSEGSNMVFGVPQLTSFNETTDELVTIEQEGFYYFNHDVRYNGENCFIDINNDWVYYYSADTLVLKPLLIADAFQLVWGYVANNTVFTSSTPNDTWDGIPYAQTLDDNVIELKSSLGRVSIADAIYADEFYYILSFDDASIYLHSISEDFSSVKLLYTFERPICKTHGSFYFLGTDIEGDINFRVSTVDRGTVYYQYEFAEQDVSLLFDPSPSIGEDIGDIKFYDDQGVYFTATDGGFNYQMWILSNDSDPNATHNIIQEKSETLTYPNPFFDKISFKKPVNNVSIYNMAGNRVNQQNSKSAINYMEGLDELPRGIYLIEYDNGKDKAVEKVVKM